MQKWMFSINTIQMKTILMSLMHRKKGNLEVDQCVLGNLYQPVKSFTHFYSPHTSTLKKYKSTQFNSKILKKWTRFGLIFCQVLINHQLILKLSKSWSRLSPTLSMSQSQKSKKRIPNQFKRKKRFYKPA